ncbi:BrnT family toxin [Ruficoccus amylovorans]|uniref:BrnT family toxin n=2 Tax=Ruficoccus amylovorans TaxID=1804625 RepID=A0A842HH15_9BACT|nr:BrnT family toxin [Ruficoccus amylovorans]
MDFEWDATKAADNLSKHQVSFQDAMLAFADPDRLITEDTAHSTDTETRYFCYGMVSERVLTVRFTIRDSKIRLIGAGYWRQGRKRYENR